VSSSGWWVLVLLQRLELRLDGGRAWLVANGLGGSISVLILTDVLVDACSWVRVGFEQPDHGRLHPTGAASHFEAKLMWAELIKPAGR